jgi:hypothetical protein
VRISFALGLKVDAAAVAAQGGSPTVRHRRGRPSRGVRCCLCFDRVSVGRATKARRQMRLGWLVVAVAASAVRVAHADNWGVSAPEHGSVSVRPDDLAAGPRAGTVTSIAAAVRVDDRGGIRRVGSTRSTAASSTSASAATRTRRSVGVRGFGPSPTPALAAVVVPRGDGFQWADAGVGAATAIAATMLLAVCVPETWVRLDLDRRRSLRAGFEGFDSRREIDRVGAGYCAWVLQAGAAADRLAAGSTIATGRYAASSYS